MENSESKNQQEGIKKNPFDELSRDELITKCKGLLGLAQKARHSKQELHNELESYKNKEEEYITSKKQYEENLQTLQEVVNSLTEQKLNYITDLESAQNKLRSLNQQCLKFEDQIKNIKADLIIKEKANDDSLIKLSNLDSENISLRRQNNRLEEENEQLLNQMSELEARTEDFNKIGLQQREQLKILEEKLQSETVFQATIKQLNAKIAALENDQPSEISESVNQFKDQMVEYENKVKELTHLYENEKMNHEKSSNKLKSYRDKISKCATCINQLKNSRFILIKTVKEYSENIPKWQNDIIAASVVLDNQLQKINQENNSLKDKLSLLEERLRKQQVNIEANRDTKILGLENEIQCLKNQKGELQDHIDDLNHKNSELNRHLEGHKENNIVKLEMDKLKKSHEVALKKNVDLEDTIKILDIKNMELKELLQNNNARSKTIDNLELQIRALESEKSILVKEKLTARDTAFELEAKNENLTGQVSKMQIDIHNLNHKIDELTKENSVSRARMESEKEGQVNVLQCQLAALQEQNDLLKKEYESIADMNGLLKEEVETLKLSLEQPKDESDNMSELHVSLQTDIVKLETKLSAYKQENASLIAEVKESRSKIKEFDKLVTDYEDAKLKLTSYKTENAELLIEMKEINQVLKERGESISKLQKAVGEMERLIDTLEKDRDASNHEKDELRKSIGILEHDLNNEKQKTTEGNDTAQILLSERDNAIKSLAEKEVIISSLREEIEKLKQQSCSAADITNEDMSTSTISKAEEYSRMRDLDETFEEKYTKLRIFALKLKKKLNETMVQLQNAEKDKERLTKLIEENAEAKVVSNDEVDHGHTKQKQVADQTVIADLETKVKTLSLSVESMESSKNELNEVKGELASVSQRLEAELEAHKATKESLEKARRDVKKKNVLSLEMEDYEKSMKDLTLKMQENKKKIVQMESTIDTQDGTIASMKVQINLLEEQIKAEEAQNRQVREELQNVIDESKEKDNVIKVKNNIISKLEQDLEDEKRKNEESNLETTSLLSDKEKLIVSLGQEKVELSNKMKRIEFKCAELHDQLNFAKIELEDLKTEHASYKVRAQAVLRQNQTVDHSQEERLKEEAAAYKSHIENLTSKLASVQQECEEAAEEAGAARRRAAEAGGELARAQQRAARLHADLHRLTQQLEAERTHHKLQVSTLTQCYKTQMGDMEARLHKELDDLRNQLTIAREAAPPPGGSALSDDSSQYVPVIPKEDSDPDMDINVSMIPREEGEGSECAPSPPPSKSYSGQGGRSPVPLERLLEQGVPEDEGDAAALALALTPDQEILDLRRKLLSQQQRVKHVTVLLAESERECARMGQLSELLKGELRRVRGAAGSAHNAEYMKNVTLKFLTLPPGDERSRLVPVLQKILSLTHEETSKIQAVAKGMDPNPKGWGSYLPWPGGK